ncbi:PLP-dependent aminotransferase family protein [Naumannella halotolerans]|uniref:HTH gntR-type domain-containing protein n=1 Tax=Naumannella halotolerans TaxID=993414 RepID=A0A4R7JBZ0_9ACTN|nr:PLP-dependent aminotransferase family protein [Naumannella halotolerans]TDT33969.1 hypothetical protein CLV29_1609 [Naumannella halotolerans]
MTWIPAPQLARLLAGKDWVAPRYRDLADRIGILIADGRVAPGTRLPSERDLATALGLSRTTVTGAYRTLLERELLLARRGSGHYIAPRPRAQESPLLPTPGAGDDGMIALTVAASPAPPQVLAAYRRATERLAELTTGTGYFPEGLPLLRHRLAERYTARGVPTDAEQIIITNGALAAQHTCARALLRRGTSAITESVGYGNSLHLLRRVSADVGADIRSFDMSPDGWDLGSLASVLSQTRASAAFVTPDFHNPTGRLMSADDRGELIEITGRLPVVADETLVDLPMPWAVPSRSLASVGDRVILIGSASKSYWGGLRLGWIRSPQRFTSSLLDAQLVGHHGSPPLEQLVLAELLAEDSPDGPRVENRDRLQELVPAAMAAVAQHLPSFDFRRPDGGQSLWLHLPRPASTRLSRIAEQHGVLITPGPHFFCNPGGEHWLRLPVVTDADTFTEAVRRIAHAWQDLLDGRNPDTGTGRQVMSA